MKANSFTREILVVITSYSIHYTKLYEVKNGVHQVLQHPRPGDRPFFGDVSHQEDRHARLLSEEDEPSRALAHLPNSPRCAGKVGGEHRLDGVDDQREGGRITSYNVCYTKLLRFPTVASTTQSDGRGWSATTTYGYQGAVFSDAERRLPPRVP